MLSKVSNPSFKDDGTDSVTSVFIFCNDYQTVCSIPMSVRDTLLPEMVVLLA